MKPYPKTLQNSAELRERVEQLLKETPESFETTPLAELHDLINGLHFSQIELEKQLVDMQEGKLVAEHKGMRLSDLYDLSPMSYFTLSSEGVITEVNRSGAALLGVDKASLVGTPFSHFVSQDNREKLQICLKSKFKCAEDGACELKLVKGDGAEICSQIAGLQIGGSGKEFAEYRIAVTDIGERKKAERFRELTLKILEILNRSRGGRNTIRSIVSLIKEYTGMEAAGIRLREGEDFPYYEAIGFSDEFIKHEMYLLARNELGESMRGADGKPILECMCGLVIRHGEMPHAPFFTKGGSFWTNSTTQLLATTKAKDRGGHIRSFCNLSGYESVGLIPLRSNEKIVGLLQLNDHREGMFDLETIELLEGLGDSIGIALEHSQHEQELRENAETLRRITEKIHDFIQSIPHAVYECDTDGIITLTNSSYSKIVGYSTDEILGMRVWDMMEPGPMKDDLPAYIKQLVEEQPPPTPYFAKYLTEDGRVTDVQIDWTYKRDGNDQVIGFVCGLADITKRVQAEEALQERRHLDGLLLDSLPHVAMLVRRDKTILAANRLAQEVGATIGGRCWHALGNCEFISDEDREYFKKHGEAPSGETHCYFCLADDALDNQKDLNDPAVQAWGRIWDTYWVPLDDDIFLHYAVDVTERKKNEQERKKLEEQIQQMQKLESLGVLAGGVAHDFNNMLMGILGNASMALTYLSPTSPLRKHIERIEKVGERAADICRQMLAYSGRGRFVIKPIDLTKIVEEMGHLLDVAVSKKVTIKYNLDYDLPSIKVDVIQIQQVLINLMNNASEAIGDDEGTINVSTGMVECDKDYLDSMYLHDDLPEGTYVCLKISDTGCGMDEDCLKKAFDPFFSTKFTGRGLGLPAILGIVRGHKGTLNIKSKPGQGTTFTVLFPSNARPVRMREKEQRPEAEGIFKEGTVLVVDDEEVVRDIVTAVLKQSGFTVIEAIDGRDAVEKFREHANEISLVLLDMTMPHLNGYETLIEMQKIRSDVKAILSSGYDEQDTIGRSPESGIMGFIQKPYRPGDLLPKIQEIFRKREESN